MSGIRFKFGAKRSGASSETGNDSWWSRRILVISLVSILVAAVLGAIGGIGLGAAIRMPKVDTLVDFTPDLITQLYDSDQEAFASYAREKRMMLKEGEVPDQVRKAILAAEDSNFLQHGGVDAEGVIRAVVKNLSEGRKAMGGSTITMQLARHLFLSPEKRWRRKIEEALLAIDLEKTYSKQQILTMYCNLVFLGQGGYGMEAAANNYFGVPSSELSIAQAATLAGIVQRPSAYNPYREPELVLTRRDYVLGRMLDEQFISQDEYESAMAEQLVLARPRKATEIASYFAEDVRRYLGATYGNDVLLSKGLQVETTLDRRIQSAAEDALRENLLRIDHRQGWRGPRAHLEVANLTEHRLESWNSYDPEHDEWVEGIVLTSGARAAQVKIDDETYDLGRAGIAWTRRQRISDVLKTGDVAWFRIEQPEDDEESAAIFLEQEPKLEGAVVVLESAAGAIRAMVGGWDFERNEFNRATQARRQVGSAFKPFVFGAALEAGFTGADTIFDAPVLFRGTTEVPHYSPRNYYRKYYGMITLRRALEASVNVSSVKLLDIVGAERVVGFARRCGMESPLPPYPSLALGSAELSPLELAAAYAAIANQGIYVKPYLIEKITAPDGSILEQHQLVARKAMEPGISYLLTHLLEGVVKRGTAVSVAKLEAHLAGKTGTTDDYTDAWFVGFTPRYTVLVWVGHDMKRTIGRNMTGAEAALPAWRAIIERGIEEGWIKSEETFVPSPGVVTVPVDRRTGLLPGPGTFETIDESFLEGTEPVLRFDQSWERLIELPWYQQEVFYTPKTGERMPSEIIPEEWALVEEAWADEED